MDNKALEKRITALELRIVQLETQQAKAAAWRARIVPPELETDENIALLMQERLKNQLDTWRGCLAADGVRIKDARIREMEAQALRELEAEGKSEQQRAEAELAAVLTYYERHKCAPPGYEIEDPLFEPVNERIF